MFYEGSSRKASYENDNKIEIMGGGQGLVGRE